MARHTPFSYIVGAIRHGGLLSDSPSPYPANERFHYSNLAYSVLGLVIESVTGRPYSVHVRDSIIAPLGLTDTSADYVSEHADRYATGYTHTHNGRQRVPIEHVTTNAMAPATGFTSTARDLALYFSAHCFGDERLLNDATKRRMQHPIWTTRDTEHYALGLQVLDIGTRRLIGHSGGYPGHSTKTWCDPTDRVVVSVLGNAVDAPASELCTGIFRLIDHVARHDATLPAHAEGVDLRSFAGRFVNLWNTYDIAAFGRRLLVIPPSQDDPTKGLGELRALDAGTALLTRAPDGYASEGEPFRFERAGSGQLKSVRGFSGMTAYSGDEYERRYLDGGRVRPDF